VGELLSNKEIAIAASFFLAFSPLFIAQSVNLNFDLPAMALVMASYYYLLKKDHLKYAIAGTMLVMTKEVGILFIAAGILSTVFYDRKWQALLPGLSRYWYSVSGHMGIIQDTAGFYSPGIHPSYYLSLFE